MAHPPCSNLRSQSLSPGYRRLQHVKKSNKFTLEFYSHISVANEYETRGLVCLVPAIMACIPQYSPSTVQIDTSSLHADTSLTKETKQNDVLERAARNGVSGQNLVETCSKKAEEDVDPEAPFAHLTEREQEILKRQIDVPEVKVGFTALFRYATTNDKIIVFISTICAIIGGGALPVLSVSQDKRFLVLNISLTYQRLCLVP